MADTNQEPTPSIHLDWGTREETKDLVWTDLDTPALEVFWEMGFEAAGDEIFERTGSHPSWSLGNRTPEIGAKINAWYARHPEKMAELREKYPNINETLGLSEGE
jgi:hypothetical protein